MSKLQRVGKNRTTIKEKQYATVVQRHEVGHCWKSEEGTPRENRDTATGPPTRHEHDGFSAKGKL